MTLTLVDYGAGNLRSVQNAFRHLGVEPVVTQSVDDIACSEVVVLPGVGHFGQLIASIDKLGLRNVLLERLKGGVPFLGICLGMQALFESSEEAPDARGFGLIKGTVKRLTGDVRVPHIGWNEVDRSEASRLLTGDRKHYYFANSFIADIDAHTVGAVEYGTHFCAVLEYGNLFGTQFHPEKSGENGLELLRNFLKVAAC